MREGHALKRRRISALDPSDDGQESQSVGKEVEGEEEERKGAHTEERRQSNTRRRRSSAKQKTTMACIQCRSSKLKCDGRKPQCTRCSKIDQECTWAATDGRSTKAKSIVSSPHYNNDQNDLYLLASTATHGRSGTELADETSQDQSLLQSLQQPSPAFETWTNDAFAEQHRLWWENDSALPRSYNPPVQQFQQSHAIDQLTFDWSTLGLEPQHLTQEVLDTLSGQIAWIDQPERVQQRRDISNTVVTSGEEATEENDDSGEGQVVRMQYLRLLGPTGISPGIKKISMEFRLTPMIRKALFDSDSPSALKGRQKLDWSRLLGMERQNSGMDAKQAIQEESIDTSHFFEGDIPAPWVIKELIPIFFDNLGDHYLCLKRRGLENRLAGQSNGVHPMLINVMCALAARFSTDSRIVASRSKSRSFTFGMEFADKAKMFLASSLSVPSRTTTLSFLMMAWHEFACNLDSAFWNYAGMALRMAIDLGIHRQSNSSSPQDLNDVDFIDDALLFWAVYQMDRVLAMGTGRPTSIKDREITCPLPRLADSSPHVNAVFAYAIRHIRIAGEIAEALNAVLSPDEMASEGIRLELDRLEDKLIESYESIPSTLRLTPQNFNASTCKHIFLEFHLQFHCLLLVLNRAPIISRRTSINPEDALKVVRKSVQRCADVVALDEAHESQILVCTPMANQTLFLAGCAELDEFVQNSAKSSNSRSSRHLMLDAMESYRHFAAVLEKMSVYWDGVRWIYGVLIQRKAGMSDNDLIELHVGTDTLVSKKEMQMLQSLHASTFIKQGANTRQSPRLQISEVVSLDELASVLPQFQNAASVGVLN